MAEDVWADEVKVANFRYRLRRGTAARWRTVNPVLEEGEQGFETDTKMIKIGDGVTHWNNLEYHGGGGTSDVALTNHVNSETPHPVYDDGPSLLLLYQNAKV